MTMPKQYTCELCKKVFNQKIDFTRHQNKKAPCISLNEIQQISQNKNIKMDEKANILNTFRNIMDILRDNEALVGPKALLNWIPLLILKMIEQHFGSDINIDDYKYDFSHIEDEMIERHKNKLLQIVRFSNLLNEKEDNIPTNIRYLWDDILSVHPSTKNIFLKGKHILIKHKSTYKKVIDKINTINLNVENDVLGDAYEEIFKDIMVGKTFGQFFTQPLVKKMMVNLINPQIHPDGKIETCGDPTMGTGGFLITYLQYILEQAKIKNINPDWNFIKTEGLYGKELDEDTYQLAVSNMLISSGHMFEQLERGDSIRDPITRKFDNILANPPFGIKGLKYDDFQSSLKNEYIPIKTDNAVSLFIQAIIYMLKINGKCAVVLPDGQDLFSKTNNTLISIREYLMKTCDLKEIIYLPSGIFTYTSIKTCVFYFIKKREGTDVLETKIKISKTQKEIGRDYNFSKTHQTSKVKFYDYNPYEDIKNLLVEVPIEKIASNSYSLNYAEYMKDETEEEKYEDGIVVKTLEEVCEFQNGSQLDKKDIIEGNIPIYGGGVKIVGFHNSYNRNGNETIVCGTGYPGYVNYSYGKPFWASQCFTLKSKNINILLDKYLYYYSKIVLENEFMSKQKGSAQKFIRFNQVIDIKIPIPSLDKQQEIVKYLDFIYEKANKTSDEKIIELKQLNQFCLNNQKIFGENVVKTLGEVCDKIVSGKFNSKDSNSVGKYPFYTNKAINPDGFCDNYCFDYDKYFILIKDGGAGDKKYGEHIGLGKIFKVFGKSGGTSHQYALIPKKDYDYDYLYQYLKFIKNEIMDLAHYTTGLGCIKKGDIEGLKISIPSLERQKEIVEYCEYNDTLIKQLEKEIDNNKKQAHQFITNILKTQTSSIDKNEVI
jgi:type I restriction-modification system DNA methylase subunit/restriction endonuclease S subunit